ncbi:PD-(D/E)XK nuclease family protein [Natrarchaeobius oligotrophus]|uniref:PD-(D/E)XK endonuclease-like domain-containing protein n=1 Tax=Natrarchaeobius chitinivorans TaxID=1679083 RepID=A0A3N6N3E5_NATCH|nr:PD-(D/E)XK nuclease family protein [Natrarchaeobius chitinivorans]RQH03452.1 hypothetical protein EA472_02540 [Natrarchaeobius chitinivorans]
MTDAITVGGLETYLACPRQYEFAHVYGLAGDDDAEADRIDLLRRAICAALEADPTEPDALVETARTRLAALWDDHDERFHSRAQRRHERRVLEATLRAYADRVGLEHARGVERLRAAAEGDPELVGPGRTLSCTVSAPVAESEPGDGTDADPGGEKTIEANVDYVYAAESSIVAVRFVPTLAPLGLLRYRSEWDGDVETLFADHFDPDADVFEPSPIAALFETAVVLDGLRGLRDRLGLERRTCRYVRIPLADRSGTSVNWVRNSVEASLEIVDLTDVYVDHHTYGMTHEHRNATVDGRLERVVGRLISGAFDPSDRWERIERRICPRCEYAVCCQERIEREVRFDG